jgi:hypothetical protein
MNMKNQQFAFKTEGACKVTFYCYSSTNRCFSVGATTTGTEYGKSAYSVSSWSTIIPAAGVVYVGKSKNGDSNVDQAIAAIKVEALPAADANITLNGNGFATYSRANAFTIISGGIAYKMALNESAKTIAGTAITGHVPAGVGVLLKGENGATVSIVDITTQAITLDGNDLKGSTKSDGSLAEKPDYCYVLSGDTFKKFTGTTLTANKAYFEATSDLSGAHAFTMTFDDGETTAIKAVEAKKVENGVFYNLAGQQVAQPSKGLYIVNGRKVIVK